LLFATLLLGSCSSFVEDKNIDPNGILPGEVQAKDIIQSVMLANQFWQTGDGSRIAMIWTNQATGSDRQYLGLNNWNLATATNFDNSWGRAYSNTMYHAKVTANKAMDENNPHLAAVAKILQAQTLGMVTSLWGDVPASEAGDFENYENPGFDDQLSVYNQTQTLLDEALALFEIDSSVEICPTGVDIYYDADKSKWAKLAHSLKARFYLHVKDYANANIQAGLGISSADEDFKTNFKNEAGAKNPYFQFMNDDRVGYLSADNAYAWRLLKPGQPNYRGHSKTNENIRVLYNYINTSIPENADLNIGAIESKFSPAASMPLVTWGDMMLIQAEFEARTNGLSAGVTALNTYRSQLRTGYSIGINDDCLDLTGNPCAGMYADFDDADFEAGGIENETGDVDAIHAFMRELYEERYVYFIGHYEAFTDIRRTDNIGEIQLRDYSNSPQRFLYPQAEINSNTSVPSPIPNVDVKTAANE